MDAHRTPPTHTHTQTSRGFVPPFVSKPLTRSHKSAEGTEGDLLIFVFQTRRGYIWLQSRRPRKTLCFLWEKEELHLVSTFSLLTRGKKKHRRGGSISLAVGWLVAFRSAWSWSRFRHLSLQVQESYFPPFFPLPSFSTRETL